MNFRYLKVVKSLFYITKSSFYYFTTLSERFHTLICDNYRTRITGIILMALMVHRRHYHRSSLLMTIEDFLQGPAYKLADWQLHSHFAYIELRSDNRHSTPLTAEDIVLLLHTEV